MANDFSYELEVRFPDCDSKKLKPVTRGVLQKNVFLEISQKSQENTCLFFNKVASLWPVTLLKKRIWHRCFPLNFANFLKTRIFYRTPLVAASGSFLLH